MSEYLVYLTFKCNWKCNYCIVDTHRRSEPINILEQVKNIKNDSTVSISGGEPGLADKQLIEETLEILKSKNCKIHLNTNGLFLEKYPRLIDSFESINYHCSENLDNYNFKRYDIKTLSYTIVLTDDNIVNLDTFLKYNYDLKFMMFSSDSILNFDGSYNKSLSKFNTLKVYTQYKQFILKECYDHFFSRCDLSKTIVIGA